MSDFIGLGLNQEILQALEEKGYKSPTEIQEKSIPLLINEDVDFIGQAQTGTGKTAAFAIPLIQKLSEGDNTKDIQSLILAPTRELACQIDAEIRGFSKFTKKIYTQLVYGGVSIEGQIRNIKKNKPSVIIGTPGRVLDLINRGALKLDKAKYAILDEADEMLNMGFIDDVMTILGCFSEEKKTWLFSATMPKPIIELVKKHLSEPELVKIKKKTMTNEDVDQLYSVVYRENKFEALKRYFDFQDGYYAIVFCQTKIESKSLADELNNSGIKADSLHGDMSQDQRNITMKRFKQKKVNLLVCTDVAARGIDIDCLTHVVNMGFPQDNESYVHRIGRTGRAGNKGVALTIVDPSESYRLAHIERLTKKQLSPYKIPTGSEIIESLMDKKIDKVLSQDLFESEELVTYLDSMLENFSERELLLKLVSQFKNEIKLKYRNGVDINVSPRSLKKKNDRRQGGRRSSPGQVRFFMNAGKEDGLNLRSLLDSISGESGVNKRNIRNVILKDRFSFFNVPNRNESDILKIKNLMIKNRKVKFEVSTK